MPRPRVKEEDRQRSAKACVPCKASKIRCDAATPCGPCSKRERVAACVYLTSSRKRQKTTHSLSHSHSHTPSHTSPFPTPSVEDDPSPHFEPSPERTRHVPPPPLISLADGLQPASTAATVTGTSTTPTPEPGQSTSRSTQARMLLSSKGERLYVGENASLSFLQFLRQILKKYMGPSTFTENQFKDKMLEVDMAHDESPAAYDQSRSDKLALVQLYREASSGILDIFTVGEVHALLDRHDVLSPSIFIEAEDRHARAEQAALNMMLAIGSQCRGQNPFDAYNATRHFTAAQKSAFEGFLCDPSLDMVRVFLLMAFYMLGACHRNAAFMYLGIASKAATALGLHRRENSGDLSSQESITRWRTWKSLLILDTIVSSILGRPGGLPPMRPNYVGNFDDDEAAYLDSPRWLASNAVFTICSHIIELEQQLGNGVNIIASTAASFLQRLRKWNETLPVQLRHFASVKEMTLGPADRELFIGATHVACTYYFTIILVTRPFLISHLISHIRRRRPNERRPSTDRPEPSHVSDLAQACLDSAMYMAKTGYMAINSTILSNNMCLLKAWMFAAGLLLGFSMFTHSEPSASRQSAEVDEAFQNAIAVLERLAVASPQAMHYFEILSSFSDAIGTRREQLGREKRKKSDRFVSQIFTADFHDGNQLQSAAPADTTLSASTGSMSVDPIVAAQDIGLSDFDFDASAYAYPAFPSHTDEWSDMPLLSDNLYIDWESVWPVMDG